MKVVTTEVEEAVISVIKIQAGLVLESEGLSNLRKVDGGREQVAECEKHIKKLEEQRQTVYEQFITGEIDREIYRTTKAGYTAQIDRLKNNIAAIKQSEIDSRSMRNIADQARVAISETQTQQEIVDSLIEKVHVFPDNHLEITWKVVGFAVV